jgi:hypothetical protein
MFFAICPQAPQKQSLLVAKVAVDTASTDTCGGHEVFDGGRLKAILPENPHGADYQFVCVH